MTTTVSSVVEGRHLKIHILRHNPQDKNSIPHVDTFEVEETAGMTLFIVLNEIQQKHDGSLLFDFVCRAGICGSCGMIINGRPGLACRTLTSGLDQDIKLAPLPAFELIGDLSVNTGKWMGFTGAAARRAVNSIVRHRPGMPVR